MQIFNFDSKSYKVITTENQSINKLNFIYDANQPDQRQTIKTLLKVIEKN